MFTHLIFEGHDTLPVIEIALESAGHTDPRIALFGASLSATTGPLTTITCRHATGTDIEHDSAHLADFEIAGLNPTSTLRTGIIFQGHLVSGSFYIGDQTPEKIAVGGPYDPYFCLSGCESSPHRTDLPFKPPRHADRARTRARLRVIPPARSPRQAPHRTGNLQRGPPHPGRSMTDGG